MRIVFLLICFAICFSACHNRNAVPSGILQESQMQSVLWDVMQADAFTNIFIKKDSSKHLIDEDTKLEKQIFDIHHISKDDFYDSYDYYKNHPDLMLTLLDSMTVQESRSEDARLKKKMNLSAVTDSLKIKELRERNLSLRPRIKSPDSIKTKELLKKNIQLKRQNASRLQSK